MRVLANNILQSLKSTVAEKGHSFPISVIAKVQYFHLQLWPFPNTVVSKHEKYPFTIPSFPNVKHQRKLGYIRYIRYIQYIRYTRGIMLDEGEVSEFSEETATSSQSEGTYTANSSK